MIDPQQVTAVVVAYNSTHMLASCLAGLRENHIGRIIIVDNQSDDDISGWCAQQAPAAQLIRNPRNEGYGRGNNIGVKAATTDVCLIVNPDAVLQPGALAALLAAAERYPAVALFGPAISEIENGHERTLFSARSPLSGYLPNAGGAVTVPTGEASTPFLMGACYLVRRAAFLRLGGFDPEIFLYYEDDDLCRRISDAQAGPVYVPAAQVRHGTGKGGTQSTRPRAGLAYVVHWHRAWSRLYVMRKYGLQQARAGRVAIRILRDITKLLRVLGDPALRERRLGTLLGELAFVRGRTARDKQQLD